jgi:hypothetical protein
LLRKELNILFLLIIVLFSSLNIASFNYIVFGKENDNEDVNDDDNRDNSREDNIIEKGEEKDDVPFILPFKAVPFP